MTRALDPHRSYAMAAAMLGAVAVAACGSNGATPDAGTLAFSTCATETRALPYQPGLQVTSSASMFKVKVVDSDPTPPVKGTDTWTIEVDDAAGAPLDGLSVSVLPWMPDHNHGTTPVAVTAAAGPGTYQLKPLYLYMSGYWEIRLSIGSGTGAAAVGDSAVVPICIP